MNKTVVSIVALAALVMLTQACAHQMMNFQPASIDPGKYVRKVDQFVIVADGSTSMGNPSAGERKMTIASDFLGALDQSIPELGYEGAVRTFGRGKCGSKGKTVLLSDLTEFSKSQIRTALQGYRCAAGTSPLNSALDASSQDLGAKDLPTAIVIVSDGMHMGTDEIASARALKRAFGDNLTIYAVQIGDEKYGAKLLGEVVAAGGEGSLHQGADLTTGDAMRDFVVDVFLKPDSDGDGVPDDLDKCPGTPKGVAVDDVGCPIDSDGDGVADYLDKCPGTPAGVTVDSVGCPLDSDGDGVADTLDKCPGTPAGVAVDAEGCPLDSDGDGVADYLDKCPGTPRGVPVDDVGCPIEGVEVVGDEWVMHGNVLFDVNRAAIKAEAQPVLAKAAEFLAEHTEYSVEIQGHTDSTGPMAWNMMLSEKRAESVKAFLVDHGVDASRLTTKGYGPNEPIASNDTVEGRARNRRVDFKPSAE